MYNKTKQTNGQFGVPTATPNSDDSIKSSDPDRRSINNTRSRSPVMSSDHSSADSGIASPTTTGTFDWPVTSGEDVPFRKPIQSLNKQSTNDDGGRHGKIDVLTYSYESGFGQTTDESTAEDEAASKLTRLYHQLTDEQVEDDFLLDERTAFESELSWKDHFESDNNSDDEFSASRSFVSGLPDHVTFSSDDDIDGVSQPMRIPNAGRRQNRNGGSNFMVSTPNANAGIDVDACYPGYPCSFQNRDAPATSDIYAMMQQLRIQARPTEADIFLNPSNARHGVVPGRCDTPNLSCI